MKPPPFEVEVNVTKFGKLTVVSKPNKAGQVSCRCDCGLPCMRALEGLRMVVAGLGEPACKKCQKADRQRQGARDLGWRRKAAPVTLPPEEKPK